MGQKDNENVVMLAPMTFRALEVIITHDPPEYLPELKDPLQTQVAADPCLATQTRCLQ